MKCSKCGTESEGNFCDNCGENLNSNTSKSSQFVANKSGISCPKCGSGNVITSSVAETSVASVTKGKTKGFGCIKACLGWIFFSIPGVLCGLCGMGKSKTKTTNVTSTSVKMVNVCQNCGWRF